MLPSFLDLDTMLVILYIAIAITLFVGFLIIMKLEGAMLRAITVTILAIGLLFMGSYVMQLKNCNKNGTQCFFYSYQVPQDDGFVN